MWKMVNVILLFKMKLVFNINFRLILFMFCFSKVVEEFIVIDYIKFVVIKVIDFN